MGTWGSISAKAQATILPLRPGPAQPTYPVFAMRQAVVADLHRQVGREQAVPQGQVTEGQKGWSASCAGVARAEGAEPLVAGAVLGSACLGGQEGALKRLPSLPI